MKIRAERCSRNYSRGSKVAPTVFIYSINRIRKSHQIVNRFARLLVRFDIKPCITVSQKDPVVGKVKNGEGNKGFLLS